MYTVHTYCTVQILVEVHDSVLHSVHLLHQPHDVVREFPPNINHVVGGQQERLDGPLVVDVERNVESVPVPSEDDSLYLPHGTGRREGEGLLEGVLSLGQDDPLQQVAVG